MKSLFRTGAVFFGVLVTSAISLSLLMAADTTTISSAQTVDANACCQPADCCEKQDCCFPDENYLCTCNPCPDCWCCGCHWEKICYTVDVPVTVDIPCKKRMCRCVPDYCSCQCCRYVCKPYNKCVCLYEPEYCDQSQAPGCDSCCEKPYRLVPKYYNEVCYGYFPEYYCVTGCKKRYEYYYVYVGCPCTKYVCQNRVQYVPRYYWQHVCGNTNCCTPCPRGLPNQAQVRQGYSYTRI